MIRTALMTLLLTAALAPSANAICIPFYCEDCELLSAGQLNLVVRHPDDGTITLIPNIRIQGSADDFGLIVPTPSVPTLEPVDTRLWDQTLQLTGRLPGSRRQVSGCSSFNDAVVSPTDGTEADGGGVEILSTERVGAFQATVLRSDDPRALATWLQDQGYAFTPEDAGFFVPYIEREWVFTAMKLDSARVTIPDRWDANVDPVAFTYAAGTFELPLSLLGINRAPFLPVEIFSVDDHRMDLDGFTTRYANRLSASEVNSIRDQYPALAAHLAPGRFLTRLHRDFRFDEAMDASPVLVRAASDAEFRWTLWSALPVELLLAGLFLAGGRRRARRREARIASPPSSV